MKVRKDGVVETQPVTGVMDTWNESGRGKVNPIVGQAGIEAGAGSVTSKTTRVALADDANTVKSRSRTKITALSFVQTLGALATYQTTWVDTSSYKYLDVDVEMASDTAAVNAYFEFTDAANPNVTPPGANDIVRKVPPPGTTIAGRTLSGLATNVLSFGVHPRMTWCRVTVSDLTGGQLIKGAVYGLEVPPEAPQLPIAANLTQDYLLPAIQVVEKARDPSGNFQATRFPGTAANQGTTSTITAGSTWTGSTRMSTAGFNGAVIIIRSDTNSAVNGVKLRLFTAQSGGIELTPALTQTYNAAPDVRYIKFPLFPGLYFTTEVTAGASDMTNIFVQTALVQEVEDVSIPLDDVPDGATIADITKAQLVFEKSGGGYANQMGSVSGNPLIAVGEHAVDTPIGPLNSTGRATKVTVTTGAAQVLLTPLASRKVIHAYFDEDNTDDVYYGYSNAITPGDPNTFKRTAGQDKIWELGHGITIYVCTNTTGQVVWVDEGA